MEKELKPPRQMTNEEIWQGVSALQRAVIKARKALVSDQSPYRDNETELMAELYEVPMGGDET